MTNTRDSEFIGLFGSNGVGKSVTTTNLIKEWKKHNSGEVYVYSPTSAFDDICTHKIVGSEIESEQWLADILENEETELLIVIDDYKHLYSTDRITSNLLKLMQVFRQRGIDIIISAHSPAMLHERLSYNITIVGLFFTTGGDSTFKKRFNEIDIALALRSIIRDYTIKTGKPTYPIFPHIFWSVKDYRISFNNMKNFSENERQIVIEYINEQIIK
jgi:energy-coupling factor transporter ATP-binding protein EcfA2